MATFTSNIRKLHMKKILISSAIMALGFSSYTYAWVGGDYDVAPPKPSMTQPVQKSSANISGIPKKWLSSGGDSHNIMTSADAGSVTSIGYGIAQGNAGFSDGIPLQQALSLILPSGWSSQVPCSIKNEDVSWQGGTWFNALQQISSQYPINFQVNWTTQSVSASAVVPVKSTPTSAPLVSTAHNAQCWPVK